MKILVIGNEIKSTDKICCYTDMWGYFLIKEFLKIGVEIAFHCLYDEKKFDEKSYIESVLKSANEADAILSLPLRYFTKIPKNIGLQLRERFPGWVAQIFDGSMLDSAPVDITFTVRDDTWKYQDNADRMKRHLKHNKYVGWAANSDFFYPEILDFNIDKPSIFVDHSTFDDVSYDYTLTILMNLKNIKKSIIAKTLTDQGIVDIDLDNINVKPYNRTPVPVHEFSSAIRNCDIFIVTHKESLGLCVLEAAMCGALILTYPNCIAPDRLSLVNHVELELGKKINWGEIFAKLNKKDNYNKVKHFTWNAVAIKMLSYLVDKK